MYYTDHLRFFVQNVSFVSNEAQNSLCIILKSCWKSMNILKYSLYNKLTQIISRFKELDMSWSFELYISPPPPQKIWDSFFNTGVFLNTFELKIISLG